MALEHDTTRMRMPEIRCSRCGSLKVDPIFSVHDDFHYMCHDCGTKLAILTTGMREVVAEAVPPSIPMLMREEEAMKMAAAIVDGGDFPSPDTVRDLLYSLMQAVFSTRPPLVSSRPMRVPFTLGPKFEWDDLAKDIAKAKEDKGSY